MRMPSLIKYFAVVGGMLFGLMVLINHLAGTEATDGKAQAAVPAPKAAVQNDPRASAVERWRNQLAAEQSQTADNASTAAKFAPEITRPTQTAAAAVPSAPVETPKSISEAAASLTSPSAEISAPAIAQDEAFAAKAAAEKAKIARTKAARAKIARERATAARLAVGEGGVPVARHYSPGRERSASNLQDQYYYGQRSASAQPPAPSQGYAYAPRPAFGPFGGFGRGW